MEQEVIHLPELAKMLGRSESSIRSARQDGANWLPPFFKQGKRVRWRVASVRKFLEEFEQGLHAPAKPGRKRQAPPTLASVR
ncbi:helix-turn-helix domain-containing protein [Pseudomonas sp. REB1044]|uniref:helix-turn-helix transcriptional regulator n=1 Tax=Pseudomonas sp. REB1044 TaxID=2675224 RepID=UPI00315C5413